MPCSPCRPSSSVSPIVGFGDLDGNHTVAVAVNRPPLDFYTPLWTLPSRNALSVEESRKNPGTSLAVLLLFQEKDSLDPWNVLGASRNALRVKENRKNPGTSLAILLLFQEKDSLDPWNVPGASRNALR